jgi:CBS domain-containing protein
MLRAEDVMRKRVLTLSPDQKVREAAALFLKHKTTGAPVVDADGRLLGVLSQRDIIRRADEQERGRVPAFYYEGDRIALSSDPVSLGEAPVKELMTRRVLKVSPRASLRDVGRIMTSKKIHRVIVAEAGELRGVISSLDLIRGLIGTK